jgi:hypothetical protein
MRDENLAHYFVKLRGFQDARNDLSCQDGLAIICLKITSSLLEDSRIGRAIAKELSLILDAKERRATEEELLSIMQNIDRDLDENLRGFSGLMELILEDTRIRREPHAALSEIKNIEPDFLVPFCRLTKALDALLELEEAFAVDVPKAATVIFLFHLKDIMGKLFDYEQEQVDQLIAIWLQCRIRNDSLAKLYEHVTACFLCQVGNIDPAVFTIDLVAALLSLWSADQHVIKREEAMMIDRILRSMGMFGIKTLAQAGFLVLEEYVNVDEGLDISPKIVLAT